MYGGLSTGVRPPDTISSALSTIEYYACEPAGTLKCKAAAYLYYFSLGHKFYDGNKRVGLASANTFLFMNGWELCMTNDEAYFVTEAVAAGMLSLTEVESLIQVCRA
jgi:death-on-curing protein